MKRARTLRHHVGFRVLHWIIFVEGVLLTLTGMQIGGIFGIHFLAENISAFHITLGLLLIVTLAALVYYLVVSGDYGWYGLRRIPLSLSFLMDEARAWFGLGPHVEEPIRFDPKKQRYVEKLIPSVVVVWWVYVVLGLSISITGMAMTFPEQFSFIYQLADLMGYAVTGAGGYALVRAIHRILMFALVMVVMMHTYAAVIFRMLHAITSGYNDEPILEIGGTTWVPTPVWMFIRRIVIWIVTKWPFRTIRDWGISYSLWPAHFTTACCGAEFAASSGPRYDAERTGFLPFAGARQCNVVFIEGTLTRKMAKAARIVFEQMPEPKYVIAMGACSLEGGIFWNSYNIVLAHEVLPVDVYIPGCPPRPEAVIRSVMMLQKKIRKYGGAKYD